MRSIARNCIIVLLGLFLSYSLHAEIVYTKADSLVYEKYMTDFAQYRAMPDNELLLQTAKYFLGKPYVASTLEKENTEKLVVNLREFDCTTFVESCLALSKTLKLDNRSFHDFCNVLQKIRYRDGLIDGYPSRLHYVSDWIYQHQKDNLLTNVSEDMGGKLYPKVINFMSEHPSSYRQLNGNEEVLKKIKNIEYQLNKRGEYYVISKDVIRKVENSMKNGDIVVFATTVAGLDFSHIGIITTDDNRITFVHASSGRNEVVVEQKSLDEYCNASKRCSGITVLRLNN